MRILRGLRSQLLACGCTAGTYETYDGRIVHVVDERAADCADSTHTLGNSIPTPWVFGRGSEVRLDSDRQRQS